MPHRHYPIAFSAGRFGARREEGGRAIAVEVTNGVVVSEIDLRTGIVSTATPVPRNPADRVLRAPRTPLPGVIERSSQTAMGPRTELFDARTPGHVAATLEGELVDAVRVGDVVLAVVSGLATRELLVVTLGSPEAPLRFASSSHVGLAVGQGFAAAASDPVDGRPHTHIVRADGRVTTIGLTGAVQFDGTDAWVLGADGLYVVDLTELPFATRHAATALTFAPAGSRAKGLREPAKVVMALSSMIVTDHPEVGRLNLSRAEGDPVVAAGDSIRIDEIEEPLPGIWKVRAWSTLTGTPSVRPGLAAQTIEAPAVAPIDRSPSAPPQRNREALEAVCASWGATPPPSMVRFLDATDTDPLLRRWLATLGLASLEVRELSTDWDADPCLLAFAGQGTGDEYAIYLYPPAFARSEIPVVEYLHESNASLFFARDFDAFLTRLLARARHDHPEIAQHVAARLGLTPPAERDPKPREADRPGWFVDDSVPVIPWDALEAQRAAGDLVGAERGVLNRYLRREGDGHARRVLTEIYAELGWRAALETLERSDG